MASNLSQAILKTEYPRGLPAKFQRKSFSTSNSLSPINPLDPFLSNLLEEVLQQQEDKRGMQTGEGISQEGGEGKASQEDSEGQQRPSCSDQRMRRRMSGGTSTIPGQGGARGGEKTVILHILEKHVKRT